MKHICPCCQRAEIAVPVLKEAGGDMDNLLNCSRCGSVLKWKGSDFEVLVKNEEEMEVAAEESLAEASIAEEPTPEPTPEASITEEPATEEPLAFEPQPAPETDEEVLASETEEPVAEPEELIPEASIAEASIAEEAPEEPPAEESIAAEEATPEPTPEASIAEEAPEEPPAEESIAAEEAPEEPPAEESIAAEEPTPEEDFSSLEEEPQEPDLDQNFSDVAEHGNSSSVSEKGVLRYNLQVSGVDSLDIEEQIREILKDSHLRLNVEEILKNREANGASGELEIKDLNPIQAWYIISELSILPVELSWEQYNVVV